MRPIVRWSIYNRPVVVLFSLILLVGGVFGLGRIQPGAASQHQASSIQ